MREQFFILKLDREQALSSLPDLLDGQSNEDIDGYISHLEHVFAASGEPSEHMAERFTKIKALFDKARPRKIEAPAKPIAAQQSAVSDEASATASTTGRRKTPRKR